LLVAICCTESSTLLLETSEGSDGLSSDTSAALVKDEEPICSTLNPMKDSKDASSSFRPSKINAGLRIQA